MPGFELIDQKEQLAIQRLFKKEGGILFAHGFDKLRKYYHVREFEKKIREKTKAKYALAVSSGTAAIKISLLAMGIRSGDEVITQAFNFIATAEAIGSIGAKVIICGIDDTLNMCPVDLEKKITKKTKAIIPVHMLGVSAEMNKIKKIANYYSIPVCEDVCEAFGGKYDRKSLGLIGKCGILSFDFGKIITTGEGGAIITNNQKIYNFAREYHDHGHKNKKIARGNDSADKFGFNYRMTEIQGIIGKVQLTKLEKIIRENFKRYNVLQKALSKNFRIRHIPNNSETTYEAFIFLEENKNIRKKIISLLNKSGFGTKNLPDAIKWHCSYFWGRGLERKQIKNSIKSKNKLSKSIAIPISLRKTIKDYQELAKKLYRIKSI